VMKAYWVGVDLGTMGTKAAIFDADGHPLTSAYEESRPHYPQPGWVEIDSSTRGPRPRWIGLPHLTRLHTNRAKTSRWGIMTAEKGGRI
jgi:hypothetical protein